ncbi:MAG: hypothetical protein KF726_02995 [Anaerolineae bacterium]|nr:hypothetical protein [Anaerolineae bacterium]
MTNKPIYPEPQHFPEALDLEDSEATALIPPPDFAPEESMPHVEHTYSKRDFACVRCGSRNLAPGYVVDYGDKFNQVHFAPKRITLGWLNSLRSLRPWRRLAKLDAVACRDCGAVLLEVDPAELRRAEYRRD